MIDNASGDGSADLVRSDFPEVTLRGASGERRLRAAVKRECRPATARRSCSSTTTCWWRRASWMRWWRRWGRRRGDGGGADDHSGHRYVDGFGIALDRGLAARRPRPPVADRYPVGMVATSAARARAWTRPSSASWPASPADSFCAATGSSARGRRRGRSPWRPSWWAGSWPGAAHSCRSMPALEDGARLDAAAAACSRPRRGRSGDRCGGVGSPATDRAVSCAALLTDPRRRALITGITGQDGSLPGRAAAREGLRGARHGAPVLHRDFPAHRADLRDQLDARTRATCSTSARWST